MALWPNGSVNIPRVSSEYNAARRHPITGKVQPHNGIDLIGWSTIKSPVDGVVTFSRYNGSAGNMIVVKDSKNDTFVMMHNKKLLVGVGARVSAGQDIAIMGTTGSSTGVHCHFETRPGDKYYENPRTFMARNSGGSTAVVSNGQRVVGPNGAKRRKAPSSTSPIAGDMLTPGTVGNFTGWMNGESVSGNSVWFQGTSGDWFWSGGFAEGPNVTGLTNLNAPSMSATQRKVVDDAQANRRIGSPTLSAPMGTALEPGTVGNFTGWISGESVGGNNVWFKGTSGDFFWSGGFVGGANTEGLPNLNSPVPPPVTPPVTPPSAIEPSQRQVVANADANARTGPGTSYGYSGSPLDPNTVGNFDGWTEGEEVSGNKIWFRGTSGRWFWSGGFVGGANTEGLPQVSFNPPVEDTRIPTYPHAEKAYNTPNGGITNSEGLRIAGRTPENATIQKLYVHHTATTNDDTAYFKVRNSRLSCPTWYVKANGKVTEFIRPSDRPWSTGAVDNYALSIETQNSTGEPAWVISNEAHEAIAQIAAWLSKQDSVDGVPVEFTLDREHIIGHKEVPGAATACPGPSMDLDRIVARAKVIAGQNIDPVPPVEPDPEGLPESLLSAWTAFRNEMDRYLSSGE